MIDKQEMFAPEMEGTKAIVREQKKSFDSERHSEKIDLRKMIIYSELLKPKFD